MIVNIRCQNPSHQTSSGNLDVGQNVLENPSVLDYIQNHINRLHPNSKSATFDLLGKTDGRMEGQIVFDNGKTTFKSRWNIAVEGAINTVKSWVPINKAKER